MKQNYKEYIPRGLNQNNIFGEPVLLRDLFLEAEQDYLKEFLNDTRIIQIVEELNALDSDLLQQAAMKLINEVEAGLYTDLDMEQIERIIILFLAAINDDIKIGVSTYSYQKTLSKRR